MNNQLLFKMLEGQNIDNKYYLNQLLGSGGFGGVYLADEVVRDRLIRTIALKLIITDNPYKQLDELIFSTTLNHPNLITCFTCGECKLNGADFLYLLMEKANYSLEDELKKGKLSEENVKQLLLDIVNGLDYLHSQNPVIVHRDLKPGNILRVGDKWKISDFGLVRSLQGTATQTTTMMGSMGYASPEAYEGKISPAWDIWSLGVVIYESLTGKLPFESDSPLHLMRQVVDLEADFSLISDYWQEIIKGCLIKDNKERFSSQDLGNKLREKIELKNNNISDNVNNIKKEKDINLLLKQADYLRESKQYREAIDLYNQVIELNPNNATAYNNRGLAYDELKQYQKAIDSYNRAIELDSNYTNAYNNLDLAYKNLKVSKKLIPIVIISFLVTFLFSWVVLLVSIYLYHYNANNYNAKYKEQISNNIKAIQLNSEDASAYNNRGVVYFYFKEYDKAIADYNKAIELDPDFQLAKDNLKIAQEKVMKNKKR
ncbi:protein kinase domain-containing protein [Cyanobacterium aponinum]|uniref:Tetratricopeptide repeat protein n=1 Tax=Cyanobacterium aponinum 0216 TaxID=2676140 RepID=A0A844GV41_9CHRO|nr:serine/threonine-protein kinase [Cyanobacterium aponinum]MTF40327.1 tetratricopeptide repeat protein [Cyanobacterium aponinum 0216]